MNISLYKLYGIIGLFPVWIFRGNLNYLDILILLIVFFILPIIVHIKILGFFSKKNPSLIFAWITLITIYGVDQNLGLLPFSNIITEIIDLRNVYKNALLFLITFTILIFLIISLIRENGIKILFSFLFAIFVFNCLDYSKNFSNFPNIKTNNKIIEKNINYPKRLILIFDEMSGIGSVDSEVDNGKATDDFIVKILLKNKFDIYSNAISLYRDTDKSLSSALNFILNKDDYLNINKEKEIQFMKKSKNYFIVNDLTKNNLFDLDYHNNIIVHQSMFINFCNHKKVIKCYQFNPFDKDIFFLNGFKNTSFTKYISIYKNNNSIISYFMWRVLREIRLIDSVLDPDGEKASINYIFNQILQSIKDINSNLIFAHLLVPHVPYGFNDKCEYDGTKGIDFNRISLNQKRARHNLERECLIKILDSFITQIKKKELYDDLEIILFSDHDARISNDSRISTDHQTNSIIFAHKKAFSKNGKIISENISLNKILFNIVNK